MTGAIGYALWSDRLPMKRLLALAIVSSVGSILLYSFLRGPISAVCIFAMFGAANIIVQLSMLDLAARVCPPGVEATFFSILAGVMAAGSKAASILGSWLYSIVGFQSLVLISAVFTATALVFLPILERTSALQSSSPTWGIRAGGV